MNLAQWFHDQLKASADGFVWAVQQVPAERRFIAPPAPLGDKYRIVLGYDCQTPATR